MKDPVVAQDHKVCRICSSGERTEDHVLLHCPVYDNLRRTFPDVSLHLSCKDRFSPLLASADQLKVAKYLAACLAARDSRGECTIV